MHQTQDISLVLSRQAALQHIASPTSTRSRRSYQQSFSSPRNPLVISCIRRCLWLVWRSFYITFIPIILFLISSCLDVLVFVDYSKKLHLIPTQFCTSTSVWVFVFLLFFSLVGDVYAVWQLSCIASFFSLYLSNKYLTLLFNCYPQNLINSHKPLFQQLILEFEHWKIFVILVCPDSYFFHKSFLQVSRLWKKP